MAEAAPKTDAGEVAGWPKLRFSYRTDPDRIAELLPPGITPGANPHVHIQIYCVPIIGEPEFGVSTKVEADFDGIEGMYNLGMGIDQEAAIFNSQSMNGQPKFPCRIRFFRLQDEVEAKCTHQGYTFLDFRGRLGDPVEVDTTPEEQNEWWIKVSRQIGGAEKEYDFPPHVVRVRTVMGMKSSQPVDGDLILRDSPWDPIAELLPMREQLSADLVTTSFHEREITNAGPLDPTAFWPFVDTIGGSRWPGERGGPRYGRG
ncbi:MAG: acetoacetate decarboxylase family protein [Acidimicrobiales bacterium]|nr:acetoacetate decarboxylase family protein [Acidimicrobiales bacterium]